MKIGRRLARQSSMNLEMLFRLNVTLSKTVVLMAAMDCLLSACTTRNSTPQVVDHSASDIVVLGTVARTGLKLPLDTARMSIDLAALLAGRGNLVVTSSQTARKIIGAGPHDEMMAFYARHSRLAPYQIQRLMAANLPSSRALVATLLSDQIKQLPMQRDAVFDAQGLQIADLERRTLETQRSTRLAAMLVDLRNGRVVWTRQYSVNPTTQLGTNHQLGDSLSASIAATVTNAMVQGLGEARYPLPPKLYDSVLALLQEVAYQVPLD